MMPSRFPRVLCFALALASVTACHYFDRKSTTEPVTIHIGAQCRSANRTIVCRDLSQSDPPNHLRTVEWELISNRTGLSLDIRQAVPGDQVSFPGLASDDYEVSQKVFADDGGTEQRTYGAFAI